MRTFYHITSAETGKVVLKCRKIAKALRWWLRGNGYQYEHGFFLGNSEVTDNFPESPVK